MTVANHRPPNRADAVMALVPTNRGFAIDIDGTLTWFPKNTEPAPSLTAIDAKLAELTTEYNNQEFQRKRQYPSLGEQLDSLYRDILADKVDATGEFAKAIKAVKDTHPKSS